MSYARALAWIREQEIEQLNRMFYAGWFYYLELVKKAIKEV